MRSIGLTLLENYPKSSQDLNPIEAVWKLLRDRLDETVPTSADPREAFVPRLRQPAPCVALTWWPQQNKHCPRQLPQGQPTRTALIRIPQYGGTPVFLSERKSRPCVLAVLLNNTYNVIY